MSYLEDDRFLREDDDDSEEYMDQPQFDANGLTSREYNKVNAQIEKTPDATIHLHICPQDYTFCFSLWRKTANGTKIEKQGKQRRLYIH